MMKSIITKIHSRLHRLISLNRRIQILSKEISNLIENNSSVLDVGCGSGEIASEIIMRCKDVKYHGIDVLIRSQCPIKVERYDGLNFPVENKSYDYVIFIDVLHHTLDPESLINEALRVARKAIIIKDHNCESYFARKIMCFTDWFGNGHLGVNLVFNFWSKAQWQAAWKRSGTSPDFYIEDFGLYPKFTRIIFTKEMDFIARLTL